MVSRFVSKPKNYYSEIPSRMTKYRAMKRGRDAALKDAEAIRKKRRENALK